jgi:hypothetical protein
MKSSTVNEADLEQIRITLRGHHEAGLSWQKIASAYGLTKGEIHAIAVYGHTPRDPQIIAKLLGTTIEIVIQHRNRAGRFTKRE